MIDSFINPLAGVLILNSGNTLVSQSYFHYVPEDNGFILDNVEASESALDSLQITTDKLSKIYRLYALKMKEKYPDIKYIKCGTGYSDIDTDMFEMVSEKEDPRHFEVDKPYSDYNEESHLDLLRPAHLKDAEIITASVWVSGNMCKTSRNNMRQYLLRYLMETSNV